jgi:hypothetical protein
MTFLSAPQVHFIVEGEASKVNFAASKIRRFKPLDTEMGALTLRSYSLQMVTPVQLSMDPFHEHP